jgi:hypothetical protein
MRVVGAQSIEAPSSLFPPCDSGAGRDDRLRKTVRPSSTNGTKRNPSVTTARHSVPASARLTTKCSKLCSGRVGKPPIGTRQDGIAIGRFVAGNHEIRRDSRDADRTLLGLANRRLQPLGHLTVNCKYTHNQHLRKRLDSSGDGFSDRDLREFGQNPQTFPIADPCSRIALNEGIANDPAGQPPEAGIVQQIVQ